MKSHIYLKLRILILFSGILTAIPGFSLTIEDYCQPGLCAPQAVQAITPMADGISYTAISQDKKGIDIFSYKTGEKVSSLFNVNDIKGELRIEDFEGYVLSANEKKILLWNNVDRIYRHSFYADYYVYDILRKTLARVSEKGKQRGAVISHDGRMVAYTRDNNIFISNLDYGTDNPITSDGEKNKIINGVSDWSYEEEFSMDNTIRWNGDDTIIAYVRFDESEVPVYAFDDYKSYCDANPLSDLYPQRYAYKYPLAGYPNSKVSVKSYNLDTRVTKNMDIPIGEDYIPSIEFDGNGNTLMVMVLNRDQNHLTLYKVNPGSTVSTPILTETSTAWLSPAAYQMAAYGKTSFIIGSERSGYRHLYEYDYNGNLIKNISAGDWNVTDYYGYDSKTGKYFLQATILGPENRNVIAIDSKGKANILNNEKGFESANFSNNFQYYVRNYSNISTPNQYTICDNSGRMLRELEMNRAYAAKYASAPAKELITVKNDAGEEMNGYIIKPINFNSSNKYPLLMYQYNGPDSQEVLNRWKMEGVYYLSSLGYIIGCVDGRGTGNRSREWATCVYQRLGELETKDQISGANYFKSLPFVDKNRTACFGWSYGGYMTLMELEAADSPFKAGIAMAPVTDWRFYDSIYTERYMRTPQQNEAGYNIASALNKSKDLKGNLLIMSGTNDDNVHFYNTLKYTSKLSSEGTVFDMMVFTGFEHSLPMCNARVRLFKKVEDFLNTRLK